MHAQVGDTDIAMLVYTVRVNIATETVEHLAPALDAVYDVTIAYADYRDPKTGALQRPNEKSLLFGQPPREVHILVQVSCCIHCITCITTQFLYVRISAVYSFSRQFTEVQCIGLAAVLGSLVSALVAQ
jgi:succinate dehydrogenase/fumarate reductase-like Fe-S protein